MTGNTYTATYDFVIGNVSSRNVTETKHDMFCPGLSRDFNGRAILSSGDDARRVSIYEPGNGSWITAPQMNLWRGYQGPLAFVIGGSWLVDPSTRGCPVDPTLIEDNNGIYREDSHDWLFSWSNSTVFLAGPSKSNLMVFRTRQQLDLASRHLIQRLNVRYRSSRRRSSEKMFTAGGAQSYENAPATNSAHLIIIGSPGDRPNAVTTPELWDPVNQTFTILPVHQIPRTNHSIALLITRRNGLDGWWRSMWKLCDEPS
ncbi:uncharacterized protein RAG0_10814 [Rhynchosporium agropyri]|uniref:Galactose oxidase n=1 Tax=Rhynchosporium agropyri TaxID=914238 RepID=A0A1E1L1G0_9HELO|nr:uncharacterized protein RAG0_10814 [Rhynchosporium agropyri]